MKRKLSCSFWGLFCVWVMYAGTSDPLLPTDTLVRHLAVDEVVVVAFKGNDRLATQPLSATTLSGQMIQKRKLTTIKDLNGFVPNFFMPDYGSKLTSPVYIRGIGSRINAPSVGLYVDGIPYFDRSSFDFNLNTIERIEVLRGPQGTLYGRNTMGGIINVYTQSPFKRRASSVNASIANYAQNKVGASHVGNWQETIGYSLSANYAHHGGYFTNQQTGKKADGMDLFSGRMRLGWIMRPQMNLYLTSAYEYSDQDGYPYGVYDAETRRVGPVNYNAPAYYRRTMWNNGLTFDYTTHAVKLSSQTSFQYLDGHQGIDQDFTPVDNYYVTFTHDQRMYSHETNIRSVDEKPYTWQWGVFGFYQEYGQCNAIEYRQMDRQTLTAVENPTVGWALYHQSNWENLAIEGLSATLGVRYDWERIRMTNRTEKQTGADNTIDPTIRGKATYTQLTPKLSLQYAFNANDRVYLSAAKGYKAGGFNTTAEDENDRVFHPEHSWSYEAGAKSSLWNDRLRMDLSLFYIDWRDQQISQKRATEQGFKLRNAGQSASKGIELSAAIDPYRELNLQLNYGYTHATFKEYLYDENKAMDYSGNFLPLVPRHTFSIVASYPWKINRWGWDKLVWNAHYRGLGKLFWNEDNRAAQSFYQTLNVDIALVRKGLSVDLWAKNITHTRYIAYYFESMGECFAQQGKPFTIGIDIHLTF